MSDLKIGSHVGMSGPDYLLGAYNEAKSYKANAFMIYSGAPQNTKRVPTEKFKIEEAYKLMENDGFDANNIILHAPYIINLANTTKPETFELATSFLVTEIKRAIDLKVKIIVLHPGSHVGAGVEAGLNQIVKGLDIVYDSLDVKDVKIALETMSGKGSECGIRFEELKYIIDNVKHNDWLGVCLDTCHIHDAGYDLNNFDQILNEFDQVIGLERLLVLHVNDSKNERSAHKDRHENLGYGKIGYDNLLKVFYHPKLMHLVKILETPYIDNKPYYLEEIAAVRNKVLPKLPK